MPKVQVETRVVDVVYALKGRYKRYGYPARFCLLLYRWLIDRYGTAPGPAGGLRLVGKQAPGTNRPDPFYEDHSGNAREISRRRDVPVLMGKETAEMLADPPRLPLYRRAVWGQMDAVSGRELSDPLETAGHRFRVICHPGPC